MTDLATTTGVQQIDATLRVLTDPNATPEDRLAAYAVGHQMQLRMNRVLRAVKDELIAYMEANGLRDVGPVSVKSSSIDPAWPCNDEANWGDWTVQDAMQTYAKVAPDYFRHVPDHWEVRTAELGAGIAAGDPVAKQLHAQMKEHGWRTDEGRRLSLSVKEAKPPKEKAA